MINNNSTKDIDAEVYLTHVGNKILRLDKKLAVLRKDFEEAKLEKKQLEEKTKKLLEVLLED